MFASAQWDRQAMLSEDRPDKPPSAAHATRPRTSASHRSFSSFSGSVVRKRRAGHRADDLFYFSELKKTFRTPPCS